MELRQYTDCRILTMLKEDEMAKQGIRRVSSNQHQCKIFKHPVESLALLPYMGLHPANLRDACPHKVRDR